MCKFNIPIEITCDFRGDTRDTAMFHIRLADEGISGHGMTLLDAIKSFDYEFTTTHYLRMSAYNSMIKDCV